MARKITTKRFIDNVRTRLKNKDITKQRARRILTGKMASVKRRKKKALADERMIMIFKRRI